MHRTFNLAPRGRAYKGQTTHEAKRARRPGQRRRRAISGQVRAKRSASPRTAPKARNIIARGKCERSEHVAPGCHPIKTLRPEGPKYVFRPFQGLAKFSLVTRGDVPTKSGLAPGYNISRLRRSPSYSALGAGFHIPPLALASYSAFGAGYNIPRLRHCLK
jgi:hypothetical protein